MTAMVSSPGFTANEYTRAVLNLLEDAASDKEHLHDTQKAVLNILDDLELEKARLEETQLEVVRSEQAVRATLREKEVLLKEIHHRVKNNLQVISSLLSLQARYLVDPAAREIFNESQNRVQSIALVHEKLYQSANLSHIDFGDYVGSLVDNLFHTHDASDRVTHHVELGGVRMAIDLAIPCGLIINELVTNSLKHAFPEERTGDVRVLLKRREGSDQLELSVSDDGVGIPADVDLRNTRSLGLDLVFTFSEQIEARVEVVREHGTTFRFLFASEGAG